MLNYWYLIISLLIFFVVVPVNIYLARQIHKINIIKNMKNKVLSWFISFIFLYLTLILLYWNNTNGYVIMLHIFFIILIGEIIYKIFRIIQKKEYKYGQEITLGVSLLVVCMYLGYGYYLAHHVVETKYVVETEKNIGVDNFRVVQISDSHIGATMNGNDFYNYMIDINKTNPDIVVVTGDFVDDDTKTIDMKKACAGLGLLQTKYGVYFVYGNHDSGYSSKKEFSDLELRQELAQNNVKILEDEGLDIVGNIYLLGRRDKKERDRKDIKELVKNIDSDKFIIELNHQPNDFDNEAAANIDLVLTGHTHGGQLFPLQYIDLGANDLIYGIKKINNTTFIVNSGIGDWAVKFRSFSKAEYVVIDIKNSK